MLIGSPRQSVGRPEAAVEIPVVAGENMKPDPINLLAIADIKTPLVGFYDFPDPAV
jgi:hypothetical protein